MRLLIGVLLLLLTMTAVDAAPTAFGCFVDTDRGVGQDGREELGSLPAGERPSRWREMCQTMAGAGMNSAAVMVRGGPDELAMYVDIGLDEGLLCVDVPFVVLGCIGNNLDRAAEFVAEARALSSHTKWPELLVYGADEAREVSEGCYEFYEEVRDQGLRSVATCAYGCIDERIPTLDVLLVSVVAGIDLEARRAAITGAGRTFGVYLVLGGAYNEVPYETARYYAGAWAWGAGAELVYAWSYQRLFEQIGGAYGKGFSDGIRDYRRLSDPFCWDFAPEALRNEH